MYIVSTKENEGRSVLTMDTGMTPRAFAQTRLPQTLSRAGYIIRPSLEIEEWIPEGTFCDETRPNAAMQVWGPLFSGDTLLASITGDDRESAWKKLYQCVSLISRASIAGKISPEIVTALSGAGPEAILLAEDGSVLLLPSDLYTRCIDGHGEKNVVENRLFWIHPDFRTQNPSWSFAFLAGTLAYRIIAGKPPFHPGDSAQAEELAVNMQKGIFEPLQLAVWEIRAAAASCINALISTGIATSTDTLLAFGPAYSSILDPSKEGIPPTSEYTGEKAKAEKKRKAIIARKRFFHRHRTSLIVGGAIAALTAVLAGTYLNDIKDRPDTKGLNALAVVTGFYRGLASLDQEIPQAYLLRGVKTEYSDLITNLYVTSKVREAYEKDVGILSPARLFLLRSPEKKTVFGITGLTAEKVSENTADAEYTVKFYIWLPFSPGSADTANPEADVQLSVYQYQDTVMLASRKGLWKISKIQNVRKDLIEGSGKALLEKIADGSADVLPYAPSRTDLEKEKAALEALQGQTF